MTQILWHLIFSIRKEACIYWSCEGSTNQSYRLVQTVTCQFDDRFGFESRDKLTDRELVVRLFLGVGPQTPFLPLSHPRSLVFSFSFSSLHIFVHHFHSFYSVSLLLLPPCCDHLATPFKMRSSLPPSLSSVLWTSNRVYVMSHDVKRSSLLTKSWKGMSAQII